MLAQVYDGPCHDLRIPAHSPGLRLPRDTARSTHSWYFVLSCRVCYFLEEGGSVNRHVRRWASIKDEFTVDAIFPMTPVTTGRFFVHVYRKWWTINTAANKSIIGKRNNKFVKNNLVRKKNIFRCARALHINLFEVRTSAAQHRLMSATGYFRAESASWWVYM